MDDLKKLADEFLVEQKAEQGRVTQERLANAQDMWLQTGGTMSEWAQLSTSVKQFAALSLPLINADPTTYTCASCLDRGFLIHERLDGSSRGWYCDCEPGLRSCALFWFGLLYPTKEQRRVNEPNRKMLEEFKMYTKTHAVQAMKIRPLLDELLRSKMAISESGE